MYFETYIRPALSKTRTSWKIAFFVSDSARWFDTNLHLEYFAHDFEIFGSSVMRTNSPNSHVSKASGQQRSRDRLQRAQSRVANALIFVNLPIHSSGWCSGSSVGCFMWFGGCSHPVLISRLMFERLAGVPSLFDIRFCHFAIRGLFMIMAHFALNSKNPTI